MKEAALTEQITINDKNSNKVEIVFEKNGQKWLTKILINDFEFSPCSFQSTGIAKQYWDLLKSQLKQEVNIEETVA